ncbi:MAG: hypothetical protein K6A43_12460 [Treponema sp.]|nr:hypothetical protein [Treponema sp.]
MNVQNVVVHADSKISGSGGRVLKDGSTVLVRIIADKGNGRYEASVAGVRINLSSKVPQKVGGSFVGTVNVLNGQIQISQLEGKNVAGGINLESLEYQSGADLFARIADEAVANFLENLGVVPDNLSYHIFNQIRQLELKIDGSLINKIHNLAKKIKGKEKLAAELLVNLYKKGIEISEEDLLELIEQLNDSGSVDSDLGNGESGLGAGGNGSNDSGFTGGESEQNAGRNGENHKKKDSEDDKDEFVFNEESEFDDKIECGNLFAVRYMLKSFLDSLFGFENDANSENESQNFVGAGVNSENNEIGALTISNHILSKNESGGSWFMFPFEIIDSARVLGGGAFRMFIESNHNLSKLNMNCKYGEKNYQFLLGLNNNHVNQIKMNIEPCTEDERKNLLGKFSGRMNKGFDNVEVLWVQKSELEGFSSDSDKLLVVDGEI